MPVLCWGHKSMCSIPLDRRTFTLPESFTYHHLTDLPKQKGQIAYRLAPNRISGWNHFWNHGAIPRSVRRTSGQVLYVAPPLVAAYLLMEWANERYVELEHGVVKAWKRQLRRDG